MKQKLAVMFSALFLDACGCSKDAKSSAGDHAAPASLQEDSS